MLHPELIDEQWTLFLDRDGVINYEKEADYIYNRNEFRFYPGAPEALAFFAKRFGKIVIVTNQKGVGKGLMTDAALNDIHTYLQETIQAAGGRIDRIYYCPDLDDNSPNRKPNPGMAMQAKADMPEINFEKSIMVGNRMSDMLFGRNAGIYTVFLATTHAETPFPHPNIDLRFNDLTAFARFLEAI